MKKLTFITAIILVSLLIGCRPKEPEVKIELYPGVDTVELNEEWVDAGALFTSGEITMAEYGQNDVDTSVLGTHKVTYLFNFLGFEHTITRYVRVEDQTPPFLTLNPGVDTVQVGEDWNDAGCTVVDNSNEVIQCMKLTIVDTSVTGSTVVEYNAVDSNGNKGVIHRVVTVID